MASTTIPEVLSDIDLLIVKYSRAASTTEDREDAADLNLKRQSLCNAHAAISEAFPTAAAVQAVVDIGRPWK